MNGEINSKTSSHPTVCLLAILLTQNDVARRLVQTSLGGKSALDFCLVRWTSAKCPAEYVLIAPASLDHNWLDVIVGSSSMYGIRTVLTREANLLKSLDQVVQEIGAEQIAIVSADSPFITGNIIDSCFTILSHSQADYIYGFNYPHGARPLVVRRDVIVKASSRILPSYLSGNVSVWLIESLPFFKGIDFPATSQFKAADLDISLTSGQAIDELATVIQHLEHKGQESITTSAVIREMRKRKQRYIRATFRLASHRPRQNIYSQSIGTRILCLCMRSEKISGGDTSLNNLLFELDPSRYRAFLAAPSLTGSLVDIVKPYVLGAIPLPILETWSDTISAELLWSAARLARFARHNHVSLIYGNNTPAGKLGAIAAFVLGLPFVTRVIAQMDHNMFEASLVTLADLVVVPSNYMMTYCQEVGIPSERIRVVHEGVDESWFGSVPPGENIRQRCGFPEGAPLIGVVSRLDDPDKALDHAIKAAKLIISEQPGTRLVFCGKPGSGATAQQNRLEQLVRQLGLEDHVRILGFFSNMRAIYPQFDLLLHPAMEEPFGLVLTEAMAMGVPPVAVRSGGVPEQVHHGHTGLLVERSEPRLLAEAALQLLNQPALRNQMSRQAQNHVRTNFTSKQYTRRMESIFDELLNSNPTIRG